MTSTSLTTGLRISKWSEISQTSSETAKLHLLTTTKKILSKEGYVFEPLTLEDLERKVRCQTCGQKMKKRDLLRYEEAIEDDGFDLSAPGKHDCMFHDGSLWKGKWECCNGHMYAQGCCSYRIHVPCIWNDLEDQWLFHKTPAPVVSGTAPSMSVPGLQSIGHSSPRSRGRGPRGRKYVNQHSQTMVSPTFASNHNVKDVRAAVALDCEMGTPKPGSCYDNLLIRISLVDFFTGEPLIDQLVEPSVNMLHYNTRYSGVTFAAMRIASRSGQTIRGTNAAREKLLQYVDSNTFIIVHGGSNDLTSLRLIHPANRIIDTHILEFYHQDVKDEKLKRNLKDVCKRRCGIAVQDAKLDNGRAAGHDSLEDAMACREIICSWMRNIPNTP